MTTQKRHTIYLSDKNLKWFISLAVSNPLISANESNYAFLAQLSKTEYRCNLNNFASRNHQNSYIFLDKWPVYLDLFDNFTLQKHTHPGGVCFVFSYPPTVLFSEIPQGPKDLEQQEYFRQHVSYDAATWERKNPREHHITRLTPLHITQALRSAHAHDGSCFGVGSRHGHTSAIS